MGNGVLSSKRNGPHTIQEAVITNDFGNLTKMLDDLSREGNSLESTRSKSKALHLAVKAESVRMIELLLRHGARAKARTCDGDNCLHLAVKTGKIDLVRLFLRDDATLIDETDKSGNTPLYLAIAFDNANIAKLLLKTGANPNSLNLSGDSPLYTAASKHKLRLVKLLLRYNADLNLRNSAGESIFLQCIRSCGRFDTLLDLSLKHGADVNLKCNDGYGALHWAVAKGSSELCDKLLRQATAVELDAPRQVDGKTALHLAIVYRDSMPMVRTIVERGANLDAIDADNKTPLYYAASKNRLEMVEYFVSGGAHVNGSKGSEPILVAAKSGYYQIVERLISYNADINVRDRSNGDTLLHIVLRSVDRGELLSQPNSTSYSHVLQLLLLDGRRLMVNVKNINGESPLRLAVDRSYYCVSNVAELLIAKGADVNCMDSQGVSLLAAAISNGRFEMARMLLDNGADPNDKLALDMAIGNSDLKGIELLLEKGATVELNSLTGYEIFGIVLRQSNERMALDLLLNGVDINFQHEHLVPLDYVNFCRGFEFRIPYSMDNVLIRHIALLSARGLFVHRNNWKIIDSHASFGKSYGLYRRELSRMKKTRICDTYSLTYFDVLDERTDRTLACLRSKAIRERFESAEYKRLFQYYWEYLHHSYSSGLKRLKLLDRSCEVLFKLFNYALSYDVIYKVIEYLSDVDLNNILMLRCL